MARRQAGLPAEYAVKVVVVRETDLLADLCVGQRGIAKQLHRFLDAQMGNLLIDAAAVALPGKIIQPRAAYGQRPADGFACQVFVQMRRQILAELFLHTVRRQPRHSLLVQRRCCQRQQVGCRFQHRVRRALQGIVGFVQGVCVQIVRSAALLRIRPFDVLILALHDVAQQQKAHHRIVDLDGRNDLDQPRMAGVDNGFLLPGRIAARRLVAQIAAGFALRHTADQAAKRRKLRRIGKHLDAVGVKYRRAQPGQAVKVLQQNQQLLFVENGSHVSAPFLNNKIVL